MFVAVRVVVDDGKVPAVGAMDVGNVAVVTHVSEVVRRRFGLIFYAALLHECVYPAYKHFASKKKRAAEPPGAPTDRGRLRGVCLHIAQRTKCTTK